MLYCFNSTCSNPFCPDGNKFCLSCGSQTLSPLFRNRYRVIRLLGEGGFGRTYEAIDTDRMDDPCVIKQFVPQVQGTAALEKATELFKQEAKRLYELGEHPQIPRLIAYFEQDKRLYLVQELIEGQTLLAELNQQGAFSEEKIRQLLADLLPVLKVVHERGVIHRDIKPENIMRRRKDGKLELIDFGVSKQVTATILGQAGTTVGTPGYAPMEQMRGQVYPASDLYSLSVTCIRLLTGCLPKEDGSDELYDALKGCWILQKHLPQGTTISTQLKKVLNKLLQDYLKDRYQSADEVLQALDCVYLEQQLFERVRNVFSEQLEVAPKEITPTSCLGDLEADELDVLELIMALEDEFDIEISDEDSYEIFKLSQTSGSGAWSWLSSSLSGISSSYRWDGQLVRLQEVTDYILQKI
jgi:acyl carrier protein